MMDQPEVVQKEVTYAQLELMAEIAYEANRVFKKSLGDESKESWAKLNPSVRESFVYATMQTIRGEDPAQQHNAWVEHKLANGWALGPANEEAKTSPHLVPYDQLPEAQLRKDKLFQCVVRAALEALVF